MKIALVAVLALVGSIDGRVTPNPFSDEYIALINSQATTWVAGRNFPVNNTIEDVKCLLGVKKSTKTPVNYNFTDEFQDIPIPETFDARLRWPNCTSVSLIRDQSACGSCWAVGAASVMSDRICIHSNGQKQTQISAAHLISCCRECGDGCSGGDPSTSFQYWRKKGVVSGGEYGTGIGCKPYPFPRCSQFGDGSKYPKCDDVIYHTPKCTRQCDSEGISFSQDLHKADSSYSVVGVARIQRDILKNGPALTNFVVFDDFLHYKSGIYQPTEHARYAGDHAVKIIGWGIENNVPYWLASNSWNEEWGDNGTFKILRGKCEFANSIEAGIPHL